jgi:hypothetical protein
MHGLVPGYDWYDRVTVHAALDSTAKVYTTPLQVSYGWGARESTVCMDFQLGLPQNMTLRLDAHTISEWGEYLS